MAAIRRQRLMKEIEMMRTDTRPGIAVWPEPDDQFDFLKARLVGPEGSPYAGGVFRLNIKIPQRYPMEPPQLQFETPIYHPNIDNSGRICLDIIVMQPKGQWKPSLNVLTVLTSLQSLIAEPNTSDPLMPDIANELDQNYPQFLAKAQKMTREYASEDTVASVGSSLAQSSSEKSNSQDKDENSLERDDPLQEEKGKGEDLLEQGVSLPDYDFDVSDKEDEGKGEKIEKEKEEEKGKEKEKEEEKEKEKEKEKEENAGAKRKATVSRGRLSLKRAKKF